MRTGLAVLLLALAMPGVTRAQSTGSITARATVSSAGLTAGSIQDLDFGAVVPGTATTIAPRTAAAAGQFRISGTSGAEVSIAFNLPVALTVGANAMPVTFLNNSGCSVAFAEWLRPLCAIFDPNVPLIRQLPGFGAPWNTIHVWIGGQANPAPTQTPGLYHGYVTLTVAYTGN